MQRQTESMGMRILFSLWGAVLTAATLYTFVA